MEVRDESHELSAIYCYIGATNRVSDYLQKARECANTDTQWYLAAVQNGVRGYLFEARVPL